MGHYLFKESYQSVIMSIQTLIEEFEDVLLHKAKLECPDMSIHITFLPF